MTRPTGIRTTARAAVLLRNTAALLAIAAGLLAPAAKAATVTMILVPPAAGSRLDESGRFTFTAVPGERNTVTLRADGPDILVSDATAALTAGSGCLSEGAAVIRCPSAAIDGGIADLGDGDDALTFAPGGGSAGVSVLGGAGDDVLTAASGGSDLTGARRRRADRR